MVLPIHETGGSECRKWRGWIVRVLGASAVFAGVWWLVSRDKTETLIAASLPWAIAAGCLAVTLTWAAVAVPVMVLIGRLGGRANRKRTERLRTGARHRNGLSR
jgi:hypothetical protein